MLTSLKNYFRRRRVLAAIRSELHTAVQMHHWGRAHNLGDRLDRVLGKPRRNCLAAYQRGKARFAAACGWPGWKFDRYTLS